jgi:16S rRNA (adenine1518-N6/adenine1519-N6)-dimethyltransferase
MSTSTLAYYKQKMLELGIEPKKALGQNFLINDSVIAKIIQATKDLQPEVLVEVGPGLGALTRFLKEMPVKKLICVELDRVFAELWRQEGLTVIEKDALQIDWTQFGNDRRILTSNLPYQISSSIVIDRSLDESPFSGMVLMFQKEVAQRMKAPLGHELYGMLSVVCQTFWDMELLVEAGPRDFSPSPKVSSRVLVFRHKESPFKDKRAFFKYVKACYVHPRRTLAGNLQEAANCSKDAVLVVLHKMNLSAQVRPHELTVKQIQQVYTDLMLSSTKVDDK